mgnify:CR=1 FL=1
MLREQEVARGPVTGGVVMTWRRVVVMEMPHEPAGLTWRRVAAVALPASWGGTSRMMNGLCRESRSPRTLLMLMVDPTSSVVKVMMTRSGSEYVASGSHDAAEVVTWLVW